MPERRVKGWFILAPMEEPAATLRDALGRLGCRVVETPRERDVGRLYLWRAGERVGIACESGEATLSRLPAALAQALGAPLTLHELEVVRGGERPDDEATQIYTTSRVVPGGAGRLVSTEEADAPDAGPPGEALGNALQSWLAEELPGARPLERVDVAHSPSALPPRLRQLALDIAVAGSWTVEPMGARFRVGLHLPDGSARISVLSEDELERLRAEASLPPKD